jgi:CheY-like chemotaxis protein
MKHFVLVIDDDPIDCIIAQKVLESTNLTEEVVTKNSGRVTLDYLNFLLNTRQKLPDHIFLDINMPEMNGFELLDQILEKFDKEVMQKVKIYFLTSSLNEEDKTRALKNKVISSFVIKPFTAEKANKLLQ